MKYLLILLLLTGCPFDICAQSPTRTAPLPWRRGFLNHTEIGTLLGGVVAPNQPGVVYSRSSFTASSFNGYRFARWLAVGATVGVDWFARNAMLPVSLGLRGDLGKRRVSPFYAFDAGYGLTWLAQRDGAKLTGGLHLNPALGLRIALNGGGALTWSLGYKHQRVRSLVEGPNDYSVRQDYRYNRLALKVGMTF